MAYLIFLMSAYYVKQAEMVVHVHLFSNNFFWI